MKIIKWILIVIVALVAIFVLAALLVPPTTYTTRFEVNRTPAVAWRVFMDGERMTEWLPGFESIETISGEPETVGSVFRLVFNEDGRRMAMEEEITALVEEKTYGFRLKHEVMTGDLVITFNDLGGRTEVITQNTVRGHGLLRPFIPLMKPSMVQRQNEGYVKLKQLIEAEPAEAE